jgi:hypothetical protein
MAFWHNTYGVSCKSQGLVGGGGGGSQMGQEMKEWTEGWLGVRLG